MSVDYLIQNPVDRLDPDIRRRAELLFDKILSYSYKLFAWAECEDLPPKLKAVTSPDVIKRNIFYTMLLNDEIHTYDQVSLSATKLTLRYIHTIG